MHLLPTTTSLSHTNVARQLWDLPTDSETASLPCPTFTFPSGGLLTINSESTITFTAQVTYLPDCTAPASFRSILLNASTSVEDYQQPFYASVTPLIYVVAATTLIAWTLLLIVLVTPRALRSPSAQNSSDWIGAAFSTVFGNSSGSGIGSRPWLQKLAALLVTASLTAVTIDTFKSAEAQYDAGFMDAQQMRREVTSGTDIRVIRVISDLFLWLAQVQTLTRLFPRPKEKLLIKWIGFLLICLDIIFSCLNSFVVDATAVKPREYQDAIPALSYLFQLALNLLYGVWVLYYALTKRKYAFFHTKMPSISIIAGMSLISVLIPIVFFIVDITQPTVGAWGDYFRWVGAAAASIVIWEWVERIEMLEREEKKDGILGQEVFDGDELFDLPYSSGDGSVRPIHSQSSGLQGLKFANGTINEFRRRFTGRKSSRRFKNRRSLIPFGSISQQRHKNETSKSSSQAIGGDGLQVEPPPLVGSPVDRSTAPSAESTVYTVHYHPVMNTPPPPSSPHEHQPAVPRNDETEEAKPDQGIQTDSITRPNALASLYDRGSKSLIHFKDRAFKRTRSSPPVEIKNALALAENRKSPKVDVQEQTTVLGRFGRLKTPKPSSLRDSELYQKPTIIPAPPRGHTWSPSTLRHSPLEVLSEEQAPKSFDARINNEVTDAGETTTKAERNDTPRPEQAPQTATEDSQERPQQEQRITETPSSAPAAAPPSSSQTPPTTQDHQNSNLQTSDQDNQAP